MNTCGQCKHFVRFAQEDNGLCFFLPPVIFSSGSKARPPVKTGERACAQVALLAEGELAAVKEKTNPTTPGQAARDFRNSKKK